MYFLKLGNSFFRFSVFTVFDMKFIFLFTIKTIQTISTRFNDMRIVTNKFINVFYLKYNDLYYLLITNLNLC